MLMLLSVVISDTDKHLTTRGAIHIHSLFVHENIYCGLLEAPH